MVVLRLLNIRLALIWLEYTFIFRLLGGTTYREQASLKKKVSLQPPTSANRNLPKETAKPAQPVQPQLPDRSANLWAERFVFLNCAQSQLVVFNLLAVQALNVKRQYGTLWSMPQPTTYPYHYIGKIQPLVKKTTTSPSNRFEMRWKWEDQILQEATTRMKYWHLKTKKRQTQTRNPYLKEADPSHLILFSVKDQNQKKGKHWLTNEQGDIK